MDNHTPPGPIAYEAYQLAYAVTYSQWRQRFPAEDQLGDAYASAWHRQVAGVRAAWAAAAQAVLGQAGLLVLDLDPEEPRDA